MKNDKYPITDVYLHPELIPMDIRPLAKSMTEQEFTEFYNGYLKAVDDSMEEPFRPNADLKFALQEWCRIDFFSMAKPPRKVTPDYRFVYRYDQSETSFYKLATGLRNAKGVNGDSIYYKATNRDKSQGVWEKE